MGNIAGLVSTISTASKEQSVSLKEVSDAVTQLDTVTQQNAEMADSTKDASQVLKDNSEQLFHITQSFQVESGAAAAQEMRLAS